MKIFAKCKYTLNVLLIKKTIFSSYRSVLKQYVVRFVSNYTIENKELQPWIGVKVSHVKLKRNRIEGIMVMLWSSKSSRRAQV